MLPVAALVAREPEDGHERVDREAPSAGAGQTAPGATGRAVKRDQEQDSGETTVVPMYSWDCLRAAVPTSKIRLAS